MLRLALLLALISGCDTFFRISEVPPTDAPVAAVADEDGDGIANDTDDCPGIFDPMQERAAGEAVGSLLG